MFLTKVGLLQKERKQDDARLSAPGPGTGVWEQRWARARLPGCVPRERRTHPVIFGGLRFWYSCSSTVQTAPLTFSTRTKHLCRLRLWRTAFCGQNGQESSAARPSPRHPDPSSSSRSSSSPSPCGSPWLWAVPATLGLSTAKCSAKPPGDAANAHSPHRHREGLGVEPPRPLVGHDPPFVDLGQMPRKMGTAWDKGQVTPARSREQSHPLRCSSLGDARQSWLIFSFLFLAPPPPPPVLVLSLPFFFTSTIFTFLNVK